MCPKLDSLFEASRFLFEEYRSNLDRVSKEILRLERFYQDCGISTPHFGHYETELIKTDNGMRAAVREIAWDECASSKRMRLIHRMVSYDCRFDSVKGWTPVTESRNVEESKPLAETKAATRVAAYLKLHSFHMHFTEVALFDGQMLKEHRDLLSSFE